MDIERYTPPDDLSPYFREYYHCHFTVGESRFIPVVDDGCYDLIFFLEQDSVLEFGPAKEQLPISCKVFTIHDLKPPYKILIKESLRFFTIKVQPWLNSSFFPVAGENGILEVSSVWGKVTSEFYTKLFDTPENVHRFKIADQFLRDQLSNFVFPTEPLVASVCKMIYEKKGMISVNELESAFNLSRQYLNQRFRSQVYYSIKDFIIIVRIMDLIKNRMSNPDRSFTRLALDYNYFDQAHFNRDFKRVTGLTPGKFFKNLAPFLLRHRT